MPTDLEVVPLNIKAMPAQLQRKVKRESSGKTATCLAWGREARSGNSVVVAFGKTCLPSPTDVILAGAHAKAL